MTIFCQKVGDTLVKEHFTRVVKSFFSAGLTNLVSCLVYFLTSVRAHPTQDAGLNMLFYNFRNEKCKKEENGRKISQKNMFLGLAPKHYKMV